MEKKMENEMETGEICVHSIANWLVWFAQECNPQLAFKSCAEPVQTEHCSEGWGAGRIRYRYSSFHTNCHTEGPWKFASMWPDFKVSVSLSPAEGN